jgi:hypothetical protein
VQVSGAVLQKSQDAPLGLGGGWFLGTNQAGYFYMVPQTPNGDNPVDEAP